MQQEPAPVINSVSPQSGSHSGGTQITLVGSYFTPAAQVTIGGRPATVLSRPDAGHLVVRTPAHAAGTVAVVVITIGGTSAPRAFVYT